MSEVKDYQEKMMRILERSSERYMEIIAKDGGFEVEYYDEYNDLNIVFFKLKGPWHYTHDELESFLDVLDRKEQDKIRNDKLRESAISKLTKEEREALGV